MEVLEGRGAFMRTDRLGHSSPSTSSRDGLSGSNDDSSVVSLKALVAKADAKAAASRPASTEDSGLIDLKSLLASAPPPSSDALPPVLQPQAAGLFDVPEATLNPYVSAAPGSASETPAPASSGPAKWFVAIAALVFVVVGTVGAIQMRTSRVDSAPANAPAAIPQAPIETPQPEQPVVAAAPKTPEIANAAPEVAPQPVATQTRTNRQSTANSVPRDNIRREATTVKSKPAEVTPPPSACDLMCEIQRAAKKKKPQ